MKVQSILAAKGPRVVSVGLDATVAEAVSTLAAHNVGVVVVVDADNHPIGILSERDIIRSLSDGPEFLRRSVAEVMTRGVVTGTPADDIEAVLHAMTSRHFRHMPIVEQEVLVGLVTLGDLVKAQLNDARGAVESLETQVMAR